jgi:hypothetical protein
MDWVMENGIDFMLNAKMQSGPARQEKTGGSTFLLKGSELKDPKTGFGSVQECSRKPTS